MRSGSGMAFPSPVAPDFAPPPASTRASPIAADSIVKMTKRTRATGLDAMNPAGDDPKVIRCFNPATGHMLGTVPVDSAEKVTEVVSAARKAQAKWARTSFQERRLVVRKIAKAVHKHRDAICKLSALDTGKTSEWRSVSGGAADLLRPAVLPARPSPTRPAPSPPPPRQAPPPPPLPA